MLLGVAMRFQLFFVSFFCLLSASAQDVVLESNPPSIKWRQVNSPNFRIIFPNGFDSQAQRVANTLEYLRTEEAKSLGTPPRKISIILQSQSATSNGFVSMLPRRSEFYAMPSQDYNFIGTNDWLEMLASHEYRHMVQFQHANRGFNRALYYLFGGATFAGMAQAAAPDWFWEGDAVATETAFIRTGRGKIPNFSLLFKTNLLEGRTFNYHKQYLRSYKHNIPNHYVLGYHMVSYLRKRTSDPEIWGKISARAWSVPFIPFIFSTAIKREAGVTVSKLYREMAADLKKDWQAQIDSLQLTPFERVNVRRRKTYTDYQFPQPMANDEVLVLKSGLSDVEQFVTLKAGEEKKVFIPGFVNESGMLSAQGDWVVWNEYGYDPRWPVRTYSLIKGFNLKTSKRVVIGDKRSRFGSAAISPDQNRIAAVRTDENYQTRLMVLSMPYGKKLFEYPNPDNDFYSMPRWSSDNNFIVALKTTKAGKAIVTRNVMSGVESVITDFSEENVGYPVMYGNYILYNSPITGIDNIFAVDITSGKKFKITSSKYGAYNPGITADGNWIYYNDQTRDGFDVVKIPFNPSQWIPFIKTTPSHLGFEHLVEQEGHPNMVSTVPANIYPAKKFSKAKGILNPYTWGAFVGQDLSGATIGISSQDLLSTTTIDIGYVYNIAEQASSYRARLSYQGLYPIIDVSASIANRSVTDDYSVEQDIEFDWKEKNIEAGLRIPLTTTSSKFASGITFGTAVGATEVSEMTNNISGTGRNGYWEYLDDGRFFYSKTNFTAARLMKRVRRDIFSKWGQSVEVEYLTTLPESNLEGNQLSATAILFFPGLFKNHSIWGYGAYQFTELVTVDNRYVFQNAIPVPRGLSIGRAENFYSASANYTMPIWYPDIAIGPLINLQRLRTNFFYDYGYGYSPTYDVIRQYGSVGIEGKIDFNILRFLPQIDMGVRYSVGLQPSETRFEILIGTVHF